MGKLTFFFVILDISVRFTSASQLVILVNQYMAMHKTCDFAYRHFSAFSIAIDWCFVQEF